MTTRQAFRRVMADRRNHRRNSIERGIFTRTARKLVWLMRGIPVSEWPND